MTYFDKCPICGNNNLECGVYTVSPPIPYWKCNACGWDYEERRRTLEGRDEGFEIKTYNNVPITLDEHKTQVNRMFKVGKRYRDAVGRKWKVMKYLHHGEYGDQMAVKRWNRIEIAFVEPDGNTATILFDFGFTTLYAEEKK